MEGGLSPNIDKLASSGTIFEAANTTVPVTLPAHCSMHTGLIPPEHGVRDNGGDQLQQEFETLAEVLCKNGYQTGSFIGAEPLKADRGMNQGFEVYDDDYSGVLTGKARFERKTERYASDVAVSTLAWLAKQSKQQPVFAFVHVFDPHWPYEKVLPGENKPSYKGEIAYTDNVIGQLISKFRQQRDPSDLLIVLTSDHGEGLGEHNEKSHCIFVYDSTLRIPLIFNGPGIDPARISAPVSVIDVAPTIVELVGIDAMDDVDGISLVDAINGEDSMEGRDSLRLGSINRN